MMPCPIVAYADVVCDLFHPGHLAFFERCRALADVLIVGLHSDDDVASYKRRPVMRLHERVAMVQACRLVDKVIAGAPLRTTATFLDAIGASFVCHGDDLDTGAQQNNYGELVQSGRVRLVPYSRAISTTAILARLHADTTSDWHTR